MINKRVDIKRIIRKAKKNNKISKQTWKKTLQTKKKSKQSVQLVKVF